MTYNAKPLDLTFRDSDRIQSLRHAFSMDYQASSKSVAPKHLEDMSIWILASESLGIARRRPKSN